MISRTGFKPGPLDPDAPTFIAGHRGLAGSALWRRFGSAGFTRLMGRSSRELDLRDRTAVYAFFAQNPVSVIVLAAAKVGGIAANSADPVGFLSDNLRIQLNVMDAALQHSVPRLLFLGSSCIYPRLAPQPIQEESLLTGHLEPTNEAYAIAKISGIMQVQAVRRQYGLPWISAMPTNLYGPGDNFDPATSHVMPALIRRFENARLAGSRTVTNWGTGNPRREFLHVDDFASACQHLLENYDDDEHINVGTGKDATIAEISSIVAEAVGYDGAIEWDSSQPDGTQQKRLDVSKMRGTGWESAIPLREGIDSTVNWYRQHVEG